MLAFTVGQVLNKSLRQKKHILGRRNVVVGRNESFRKMARAACNLFSLKEKLWCLFVLPGCQDSSLTSCC